MLPLVILPLTATLALPSLSYERAVALQRLSSDPEIAAAPFTVHLPLVVRPEKWPAMNRAFELRFIELLNQERARHGLGPVSEEPCLVAAARRHARDMAVNGFVGHTGYGRRRTRRSRPSGRVPSQGGASAKWRAETRRRNWGSQAS
ncbi:MAG: CAP domain-containing protein [Roseiflexaceae bacterium]|nr:CAP domain-containing protein [Roseiflexaceae bacterium]